MNTDLDKLRHSTAHLLAAAVLELWPQTKPTIGPAIENGFYYDFDFDSPISEEDLPRIEAKMAELLPNWVAFSHEELTVDEARAKFANNPYKLELIEEIVEKGEKITVYKCGDFEDLCRGGHSENPNKDIGAFKLTSLAGAYWRGSEKNKMLTRIYGTVFGTQEELDNHLKLMEEAKVYDHRKLGQELSLFTFADEIGPGLVLWLPNGTVIKDELEKLAKEMERKAHYQRISTPLIAKAKLFEMSGHLPYYKDDMFPEMKMDNSEYYLKPMNCPFMHLVFKATPHSYRDLPVRLAEFGHVHRYEESGTLMGLMRVRGITQNDAHIYTNEENVKAEIKAVLELHKYYYELFGIKDYYIELALPDLQNKKDKYIDDADGWNKSVDILRSVAQETGIEVEEKIGEAAFYGPKFDFNIKSISGRTFGASTNQLDFGAGHRFGLSYTDTDGQSKTVPYVIHRAPLGSTERFIGFLLEHYKGALPTWLSPQQVSIVPISDKHNEYAQMIEKTLFDVGIRVIADLRSDTMQNKIREAQMKKVPYMLVVGDKEVEIESVAVRSRAGENLGVMKIDEFVTKITAEIESRASS
jgi:threonyl-tRNA synthetase